MQDVVALVALLKDCGKKKNLYEGSRLHADVLKRGLLKSPYIASSLISMYARCGVLTKAHLVLEALCIRDTISWNALIAGYAQQRHAHEALDCFERMKMEGVSPDGVTFTCVLKACATVGAINTGKEIHHDIFRMGLLKKNIVLGNALVDMYAKCGLPRKAHLVLQELPVRDVVSWSALIAGYAQEGKGNKALDCFEQMQRERFSPDSVTFLSLLKACSNTRALKKGRKIHEEIVSRGLLERNLALGNALVDMYAKCGALAKAQQVLEELPVRNIISWSTLIAGYALEGKAQEAFDSYERMSREGLYPNDATYIGILKACSCIGAIEKGEQIHKDIIERGFLEKNLALGNALVDMYAKCGVLSKAQKVLEALPVRDIVSWSSLIAGYAQEGEGQEALSCFEQLQREGLVPDEVTFICILNACGSIGAIDKGKQIHDEIVSQKLLEKNLVLGNALVDMYSKCADLEKAYKVLRHLPVRDVITWNTIIAGYVLEEEGHEALSCFAQMQRESIYPNDITFVCILRACGSITAIDKGKQFHDEIVAKGLLKKNIVLGTALVDMYSRCGLLMKAQQVLEELPVRNVITWNALIAGYAQEAQYHETLRCIHQMEKEGLCPDEVTLLCVLNACSHSGKLYEAQTYYEHMSKIWRVTPNLEHHTCMVVVFGSAGCFDSALSVMKMMPSSDDPSVWLALLGACRKWSNVRLGKLAFDQVIQQDKNFAAAYILMANIYNSAGMEEDARKLEAMKSSDAFWKKAGKAMWIDANGSICIQYGKRSQYALRVKLSMQI